MEQVKAALCDIRKAYRQIYRLQTRIRDIVFYIQYRLKDNDALGRQRCSNGFYRHNGVDNKYSPFRISRDEDCWNFLPGLMFEYFISYKALQGKKMQMSVIQVIDDGFALADEKEASIYNIDSFKAADESHTYLVFAIEVVKNGNANFSNWMENLPCDKTEKETDEYLWNFIRSKRDVTISRLETKEDVFIMKRYPLELFTSQQNVDKVLSDFSSIVEKECGLNMLEDEGVILDNQ